MLIKSAANIAAQNIFSVCQKILIFGVSNNNWCMILSFGCKETQKIWEGERVKKISNEIQEIGRRNLRMLNNSQNLTDL